jgi:hypothetical protein
MIWFGAYDIRSLVINSTEPSNKSVTSFGVVFYYEIMHSTGICNEQFRFVCCLVKGEKNILTL